MNIDQSASAHLSDDWGAGRAWRLSVSN